MTTLSPKNAVVTLAVLAGTLAGGSIAEAGGLRINLRPSIVPHINRRIAPVIVKPRIVSQPNLYVRRTIVQPRVAPILPVAIQRAKLGIMWRWDSRRGVVVTRVLPHSVAYRNGIEVGDVLYSMFGSRIRSGSDARRLLQHAETHHNGVLEMLVLDHRTYQLVPMHISLYDDVHDHDHGHGHVY